MRQMIERDYNHPSVFSWIAYNEAWGIVSKVNGKDVYTPETQQNVIRSVRLAKQLLVDIRRARLAPAQRVGLGRRIGELIRK